MINNEAENKLLITCGVVSIQTPPKMPVEINSRIIIINLQQYYKFNYIKLEIYITNISWYI